MSVCGLPGSNVAQIACGKCRNSTSYVWVRCGVPQTGGYPEISYLGSSHCCRGSVLDKTPILLVFSAVPEKADFRKTAAVELNYVSVRS